MIPYPHKIEHDMKKFFQTLNEKDRRRYAAIEASKSGHGGIGYISRLFGCDLQTISSGLADLKALPIDCGYEPRIRQEGGGRKPYHQTKADIDEKFPAVLRDHTAGDPMKETIVRTDLKPS